VTAARGELVPDGSDNARLRTTNQQIVDGYRALAEALEGQGEPTLGERVKTFANQIDRSAARLNVERGRDGERAPGRDLDRTR
jgi:hypothetical protein